MEKTINSKILYQRKNLKIRVDEVQLPNGKTMTLEAVDHPGAVAILPILDDGRILLVKQYRHSAGKELLELPAGTLEPNEALDICARRELKEETGYSAGSMKKLVAMYMAPGYSNEVIHLYLATALKAGSPKNEEDESITLESYGFEELLKMFEENKIEDAKTIAGVLTYITRG
jgi:ADP-ribose pyrophosphatase